MKSMHRRSFLAQSALGAAGWLLPEYTWSYGEGLEKKKRPAHTLTILHTNDQHSRIDPFPAGAPKHAGEGGFARRHALIRRIRQEATGPVILLDAGDVFQGTPYFNFYGGQLEFHLMSCMGYDACTLGNHDFDNGLEGLEKMLPHARFPFVCSNYDFSATRLKGRFPRHLILKRGGLKVGIYGLGISPENLIPEKLFGATRFLDPLEVALALESELAEKHHCDLVVCLSHLGYQYEKEKRLSDVTLAPQLKYTHLIIGGHTHTFLDEPLRLTGSAGNTVVVTQAGWAGLRLGRIDFQWDDKKKLLSGRFFMEKIF
ncbi:MAG: metallophosphatase [Flavobacteriales bacterium]|nr:metallophosphatase [Flavobacteriales bacterium]